jgi:hypothetical protein
VLCASFVAVAIINWRKRRFTRGIGRYLILLAGLCCCGFLGLSTLDNASDAQHASFTGQVRVTGYQYGPRGTHINLYRACVTNCDTPGVQLVMEPKAQSVLRDHQELPAFKIGYLVEAVKVLSGKTAYKVVDISDPSTGIYFYHLDTNRHPWRAELFFADAAFFILAGLLDFCLSFSSLANTR